jgi:hypothetical protein
MFLHFELDLNPGSGDCVILFRSTLILYIQVLGCTKRILCQAT